MKKGKLFVISGPSAVGKGTIVKEVLRRRDGDAVVSVSATTREPREGEVHGVSYYFLSEEEFVKKIDESGFIEHAQVHGNRYGTPKDPVEKMLEEGRDVILEIDVQGAMQVKRYTDEAVYLFILPPSLEDLRSRIRKRNTETEEQINVRLGKAVAEIEYLHRYDYAVVNDDLEQAVQDVLSIMNAEDKRLGRDVDAIIRKYREEK